MPPSQASIDAATYRMTRWAYPNSTVQTTDGNLRFDEWLQSQVDLNKERWNEAWVQVGNDGRIAMYCWAGQQLPVEPDAEEDRE